MEKDGAGGGQVYARALLLHYLGESRAQWGNCKRVMHGYLSAKTTGVYRRPVRAGKREKEKTLLILKVPRAAHCLHGRGDAPCPTRAHKHTRKPTNEGDANDGARKKEESREPHTRSSGTTGVKVSVYNKCEG